MPTSVRLLPFLALSLVWCALSGCSDAVQASHAPGKAGAAGAAGSAGQAAAAGSAAADAADGGSAGEGGSTGEGGGAGESPSAGAAGEVGNDPVLVERPALTVLTPDAGSIVSSSRTVLAFRVERAPAIAYSVQVGQGEVASSEQALAVNDEVELPLSLSEGVNTVQLTLSDKQGVADRVTWVLIYEPEVAARPSLEISSPKTGALVHASQLALTFEVQGAPALGYAVFGGAGGDQSVSKALAVGESVTVQVELASGSNLLAVALNDAAGEAQRQSIVVVYEPTSAPTVLIDSPSAGSFVYSNKIAVTGRIVSVRPITAQYRVDGGAFEPLTLSKAPEGYAFSFDAALAIGSHDLEVSATDDLAETSSASVSVSRTADTAAPTLELSFPRTEHAVKTRRVFVRGTVNDNHSVAGVTLVKGAQRVAATLDGEHGFRAWLDLEPGKNNYEIHALDPDQNEIVLASSVYYGQRLGAGGANGGFLKGGELFTWGRNNLGQTGLDYVSHESRTAYCDRTLPAGSVDVTWCKAISISNAQAVCDLGRGAGTAAATQCRADVASKRTAICTAAGASAPTSCGTSTTANLVTACEAAYGAGTPASTTCKTDLICAGAYDTGTPERTACAARVSATPNAYPAPATPSSATRVTKFSTLPTPAAAPGSEVSFASLGVQFVSLAFNQNSASALDSAGRLWSWGDGAFGVLCLGDSIADDDANDRQIPHRALDFGAPSTTAIAISRGYNHLLVLRSDGTVWACGQNNVGQLGDGTSGTANNRALPVQVLGLPANVIQVAASSQSSYALTADGKVYAWGRNQYGNLGQGTASTSTAAQATPLLVPNLSNVTVLANGRDHVLAARVDGSVYAWGLNASNQVGPSTGDVLSPIAVSNVSDAVAVYGNGNQGFYEDSEGRLFGWGQNGSTANLGIPDSADQPAPTTSVFGLSAVSDAGIGATHGYALKGDNVFAWGWSFYGSLGGGSSTIQAWGYRTPILVQFLP